MTVEGTLIMQTNKEKLVDIRNLKTWFYTDQGVVKAVNDVSYDIREGETLGLVGESGCGKSVTAMSIMRLIPDPPGKIVSGSIMFEGKHDLATMPMQKVRKIRGNEIGMIFQEPMTSLNPVYTVGNQIIEAIELHLGKEGDEARELAIDALRKVGIPSPESRIDTYPHQMSGGMKQRVMIAMSLVCNPKLLIADEPTTALDVTIQAQILDLMRDLQIKYGMSILMITHDLAVVAEMAHRVVVMYASKIVEKADVETLYDKPLHPYTVGLFESIPKLSSTAKNLTPIEGVVPNPLEFPAGCKFHTRCKKVMNKCRVEEPPLFEPEPGHHVACWLHDTGRQS